MQGGTTKVIRALGDDGTLAPEHDPKLSWDELRLVYRHMVETRLLDERLTALQRQGRIGFHVGWLGEEAAILGSASAMREQDWIFPCYREFGAALLRGLPLQRYIDNMFGNANDTVKGRQMPDHYTLPPGALHARSARRSARRSRRPWASPGPPRCSSEDLATLVYFGDGATSSNDFHSGMNFAGVFKAPSVFFCRNNGWAISVPTERQTARETFAEKGVAYGMPGVRVDGNDCSRWSPSTRDAVARAARGEGPTLIEALTYRMGGHSTSDDPNAYRADDELEPWAGSRSDRAPAPLPRAARRVDASARRTSSRPRSDERFRGAVAVAEKTPPPTLGTMFETCTRAALAPGRAAASASGRAARRLSSADTRSIGR